MEGVDLEDSFFSDRLGPLTISKTYPSESSTREHFFVWSSPSSQAWPWLEKSHGYYPPGFFFWLSSVFAVGGLYFKKKLSVSWTRAWAEREKNQKVRGLRKSKDLCVCVCVRSLGLWRPARRFSYKIKEKVCKKKKKRSFDCVKYWTQKRLWRPTLSAQ